jgi:diguanylate cyclase (GGDEF)-like protein
MDKLFRKVKRTVNTLTAQPLEVSLQSVPIVKNLYMRLVETLQDKDKQLQSLTRAYLGAFTIIGIISILGHVATYYITAGQKENAEVTFTIIKMRSLVDTIQSEASAFKSSGNTFDDNLLTGSITELKTECTKTEAYGSEAMNRIFHDAPYNLNDRLKKFMNMADEFSRHKRQNEGPETAASFIVLTGQETKLLDINLDLALDQYRADVLKEIDRSSNMQAAGVLIILLVLTMEGGFIFRPLVNHLREYHKYLIKLALTDMLTGLNNRRAFMQLANAGLDYYNRHKTPFVLVLMDLDHFKKVNDTYGHKVGDLVLQHYSAILQKGLRAHDTVGRIGGEEFAIFLPQTTAEEAMPMIERVRSKVAETPCAYMDGNGQPQKLSYSSSFGAVAVTEGAWTLDDLFIRADEQLYKAKEQGRNCTVMKKV